MARRGTADEQGFSLIEVLVTMVLMGIVGTIITTNMVSAMRVTRVQDDETRTLVTAKVAMERMTREIRGANALTVCQPREIGFTTTRNNVRTAITFRVDATSATLSEINEDKTVTNLVTKASTTTHAKVLNGLAVGTSAAIFSYADAAGTLLAPETTSPVTYNPGLAKSIGVQVLMRRIQGHPAVQLYQLVSIRNLEV